MTIYAVTGGAGFIGSHIVRALLGEGGAVRVLDDLSTGRRANLEPVLDRVELIEADICEEDALARLCDGARHVFHHAAMASVPRSMDDPRECNRVNAEGTLRLLQAAHRHGVQRVVYAPTSAAYGNTRQMPITERVLPAPTSPYAVSKLAGEHYCRCFAEAFGLETVALRYFNVYGPRQDPSGQYAAVVPIFIEKVLAGQKPVIYGDGEQTRDFVYVREVARANLRAADAPGASGAFCNIARGRRYSVNELLSAILEIAGRDVQPVYADERPGDIKHSGADISRARELVGFEPRTSLEDGLRETIGWYAEHGNN